MITIIAFLLGLFIGGVVSFFVASCILVEHKWDRQKVYDEGYTAGFNARRDLT